MPRYSDKVGAFIAAEQVHPGGRRTVKTQDFVKELEKVNWHLSPCEANEWIRLYVTGYRDISTLEGEDKTYQCYNPYGGF